MIPVTKPYLPSREKLDQYIDGIYEREWLTNNGQLVQELTRRLEKYLGVENLLLVANGTLALQVAYRALGVSDLRKATTPEAITTPFTFIATASSLKWDGVDPVFVDIDPDSWCLSPDKIEEALTPNTRAIVPVHVFGNGCDVEAIDTIAERHNIKVIYDASHAFGVNYKDESLLMHGDAATLSFHATKLFHTGEGGGIVFKRKEDLERAKKIINFGITGPDSIGELGINAKLNEFQAAMGLCILDEIEQITSRRREVTEQYNQYLYGQVQQQKITDYCTPNYAYYPVVLETEERVLDLLSSLEKKKIIARRYFYPSLASVGYLSTKISSCEEAEKLSKRILCLPLYFSLADKTVVEISNECLRVNQKQVSIF